MRGHVHIYIYLDQRRHTSIDNLPYVHKRDNMRIGSARLVREQTRSAADEGREQAHSRAHQDTVPQALQAR